MILRLSILLTVLLSLAGCGAATTQLRQEMAPQISTEVAVQVGTAVVEHVATALAESSSATFSEEAGARVKEETGLVTRVIDGDTIDVRLGDKTVRIRYVQTNTPERDEPCFRESTQANADLVAHKTVRLLAEQKGSGPFRAAPALCLCRRYQC